MGWVLLLCLVSAHHLQAFRPPSNLIELYVRAPSSTYMTSDSQGPSGKGFGRSIPRPKVISPSQGKVNPELEKFLMMYTCKQYLHSM